ncbi:tetratricopeptide repeat protein [Microseira wollei]|uniref:Tetratricopeptide TPR_2 n=1 Tax=Microseira wollei NIES-4236 TaxID=2530354 RepID=A0AAV3X872_9CYAN|nr:tetratricopeptide repeat protein [Microseira wollei]GET36836.1 tetratricopeptide TPR_2 [Microseira wollei NIES-4236]
MQRDEAAIAAYEKVTSIQPDFYQAWYNQGIILTKMHEDNQAIYA